ncbi:DUF6196 family protein [Actinoplanes sp. NPDC049596]|uniref:DUF6196 family protein n=1 Tax=unclassified Actinoplanes TaxID=2626549 RepID=UPI00341E6F44
MVDVSHETEEQTDQRLRRVLGLTEMVVQEGAWYFQESPASRPPLLTSRTLAVVRDEESWSALVPLDRDSTEPVEVFGVFSFHFPVGVDNSGFVGWLATHLKRRLGTGVFVVCGSNRARGGIYDYWGCPHDLLPQVMTAIDELSAQ